MTHRALVNRIKKDLKAAGAKALKMAGGSRCESGTPDLIGCYRGRAFAIEVKVGDDSLSPIQLARLVEWEQAGVRTVVARENFDIDLFLEGLKEVRP